MDREFQRRFFGWISVLCVYAVLSAFSAYAQDPLPSWKEGDTKQQILSFVKRVTTSSSSHFVSPGERIATFDNDGTLWSEQPAYFQLLFAMDRVKTLSTQHPEWKNQMPFKAVLDHDMSALAASGEKGLLQLVMASLRWNDHSRI